MKTLSQLQLESHEHAVNCGFYDPPRTYGESIALMHSELSEALEEIRDHPTNPDLIYKIDGSDKPEGFAVELADCVIRILDTCEYIGVDLQEVIEMKMAYNLTRGHRHGGKAI